MGYRNYIGYIPKSKLPEIMKKVEELKGKIGTPKEDDPEENYTNWDITDYLQEQATLLHEFGKLYYNENGKKVREIIEKNKTQDFSNEDTEFFFVKKDVFLELSYAYMDSYCEYAKEAKSKLDEMKKQDTPLTDDQKGFIAELSYDFWVNIFRNQHRDDVLKPYNPAYFNYGCCEFHMLHEYFDCENNAICVWGY